MSTFFLPRRAAQRPGLSRAADAAHYLREQTWLCAFPLRWGSVAASALKRCWAAARHNAASADPTDCAQF